ncbi:MAG: HAD family hydrolase [Patescibacteria group bacterium]|jgi:phosphoserine phosphatase
MPTVIIDLDHTLLDTTRFKQALAKSLGLSTAKWDEIYEQFVADNGLFSPTDFLAGASTEQRNQFYKTLNQLPSFLYPDSLTFLDRVLKQHWQVIILTFGDKPWQQLKLKHLPLPKVVRTITTDLSKHLIIKDLLDTKKTIVIDDNAKELDAIKRAYPEIITYWMQRPNGKYHTKPINVNFCINNLTINL